MKKTISILIITILLIEIVAFFLLKFDHTELFSIRNYIEKTNDNRVFTLKKNYDDDELDHTYEGRTFSIVTSSERLRISKKDKNNLSIKNEANKPKFSAKSRTAEYERAINLLNNTFSDFSLKRSDVLYFDVSSELNINSDEMFIDYCCHLSGKDAELMAKKLTEFIKKNI